MQSPVLKIVPFLLIGLCTAFTTPAQLLDYHLAKADSLFQQKRYTQSLELYQSIFERNQYSPAMLLKMAFMEEGLGRTANVLYYLSLYYQATDDRRVVPKIQEVATRHDLEGFEFTDAEQFQRKYQVYHFPITLVLASLVLFLGSLVVYQRGRKRKPIGAWSGMIVVLVLLAVHVNFPFQTATAIVSRPGTYLMSGPSAGASVVRIVEEGHRVKILGYHDVWTKVMLNNQEVYIKADNLLAIRL
jgi:hypothetical protein